MGFDSVFIDFSHSAFFTVWLHVVLRLQVCCFQVAVSSWLRLGWRFGKFYVAVWAYFGLVWWGLDVW